MPINFSVSSQSELLSAIDAAGAGDTIFLEPGFYGDLSLVNVKFASEVTIRSADPEDPAVFNSIEVKFSENLVFDDLEFDFQPTPETENHSAAFLVDYSKSITISNSYFEGGDAVAGSPADIEPGSQGTNGIEGYPIGAAIQLLRSDDLTIINNEITHFGKGIGFDQIDGVLISGNSTFDLRQTHIGGGEINNAEISDNHLSTSNPWNHGGMGDHANFIKIYHRFEDGATMENIVIRDNVMEQGDGAPIVGIYLDNNEMGNGFANILIEDNIIHNSNATGIRVEMADGLVIQNNTLLSTVTEEGLTPGLVLIDSARYGEVSNNIVGSIIGNSYQDDVWNKISGSGNLVVQSHDPSEPNYVGDLFVNALGKGGELDDLLAIPDSAADGVGSSLLKTDGSFQGDFGLFSSIAGEGKDIGTITFDKLAIFNGGSPTDFKGATVEWDFGDGNSSSGFSPTYTYGHAGLYVVKATVTQADGSLISIDRTILVGSSEAISVDFESGYEDLSDDTNAAEVTGSYTTSTTAGDTAIRLGKNSFIEYERTADIDGNPEFTVSVNLTMDGTGQDGMVLNLSGGFSIAIVNGQVRASGTTSEGDNYYLNSGSSLLQNGIEHSLALTYAESTGTATLFFDGQAVDSESGLTGVQTATKSHDFHIGGNEFSSSFTGLIDEVEFSLYAKSPTEIMNDHLGTETQEPDESVSPDPVLQNDEPDTAKETIPLEQTEEQQMLEGVLYWSDPVVTPFTPEPVEKPEPVEEDLAPIKRLDQVDESTGTQEPDESVTPDPVLQNDEPDTAKETIPLEQTEEEQMLEDVLFWSDPVVAPVTPEPIEEPEPVAEDLVQIKQRTWWDRIDLFRNSLDQVDESTGTQEPDESVTPDPVLQNDETDTAKETIPLEQTEEEQMLEDVLFWSDPVVAPVTPEPIEEPEPVAEDLVQIKQRTWWDRIDLFRNSLDQVDEEEEGQPLLSRGGGGEDIDLSVGNVFPTFKPEWFERRDADDDEEEDADREFDLAML